MKTRVWVVVILAALVAMATLAAAQAKKSKPAPGGTKVEQGMPGCGMKGAGAKADADGKAGCGMEKAMGAGMAGCGMHGAGTKGCGMGRMAGGPGMCGPGMGRGMAAGMRGPGMDAGMCGPGMGLGCDPGMVRELGLSADQQKRVAEVCGRHQKLMIRDQADVRVAMIDLRQLAGEERPDRAKLDAQIDKIAALRVAMAKDRVGALLEVRSILTPEQLKKWRERPMGDDGMGED